MKIETIPRIHGQSIDEVVPFERTAADLALLIADGHPCDVRGKSLATLRQEFALRGPDQSDEDADQFCRELITKLRGCGWTKEHAGFWVGAIQDSAYCIASDMDSATGAGSPFDPSARQ